MGIAQQMSGARPSRLTTIELGVAGALMIVSGASVLGLALAGSAGSSISLSAQTVGALALGGLLIASGIESVRRRHFSFAVLMPSAYALFNLGYAVQSGQGYALVTVAMFGDRCRARGFLPAVIPGLTCSFCERPRSRLGHRSATPPRSARQVAFGR
jgi:hypothetical protein